MATFKSAAVEEFFNRVHSPADGKFSTSGTGGGHYKGRGAGKPAPKGSGGASKAAAPAAKAATPAKKGGGVSFYKAQPVAKPNAGLAARRAFQDARDAKKAAPSKPAAETSAQRVARIQAVRTAAKDRGSKAPVPAKPKPKEDKEDNTLNAIAKIKTDHQNAPKPAGPKPAMNKQDANRYAPPPAKKIKLSDRLKNVGKFAKKLGEGVMKDNMTTAEYNTYKKSHDPKFKGERLNIRNTFLTGRQQRN